MPERQHPEDRFFLGEFFAPGKEVGPVTWLRPKAASGNSNAFFLGHGPLVRHSAGLTLLLDCAATR